MDIKEYIAQVKRVKEKRVHKVSGCHKMIESYRYYNRVKPQGHEFMMSSVQHSKFIKAVNNAVIDYLIENGNAEIPIFGKLHIHRTIVEPKMVDGKLVYHAPVDWDKTLELWAEDVESRVAKTLIKREPGALYSVRWIKTNPKLCNMSFFRLNTSRNLRLKLKSKVTENKVKQFYVNRWHKEALA